MIARIGLPRNKGRVDRSAHVCSSRLLDAPSAAPLLADKPQDRCSATIALHRRMARMAKPMDYRSTMQRVINYVEDRVEDRLPLDDLCKVARLSAFHFARLFAVYTGLSPASYVRRRKMVHAARSIGGGDRILDVALRFGYSSHGAFSRAFRGAMGFCPRDCEKAKMADSAAPMVVHTKKSRVREDGMVNYETELLSIRSFQAGDWRGIQDLAVDLSRSPAAQFDHPWPTSDQGCQAMEGHFRGSQSYWAVCRKADNRIVGVIVFNGIEDGALDLGHLFHSRHMSRDMSLQALRRMVQYVFDEMPVRRIVTRNAAAWPGQTEPLFALGFLKTGEERGSFAKRPDGVPVEFLGYTLEMSREDWERRTTG